MVYFLMFLSLIGSWFLPWWWVAPLAFWGGYRSRSSIHAFSNGFLSIAAVWLALSYYWDLRHQGQVSLRLGELLNLPHPMLTYVMASIAGGLVAGTAAVSGHYFVKWRHGLGKAL